jgi:hypothetical protein
MRGGLATGKNPGFRFAHPGYELDRMKGIRIERTFLGRREIYGPGLDHRCP